MRVIVCALTSQFGFIMDTHNEASTVGSCGLGGWWGSGKYIEGGRDDFTFIAKRDFFVK